MYDTAHPITHNEDPVSDPAIVGGELPSSNVRSLHVLGRLQTSLDIQRVIELFSTELQRDVAHDAFSYRNADHGVEVGVGQSADHRCQYRLVVEGEALGQVEVSRSTPFKHDEIRTVEELLVCLVYPLRNALMYQRALHSAHKDPLTGLFNRKALDAALSREIKLARRHKQALSLIVLDLDNFKAVNDRFGHSTGDAVLKTLAETLTRCTRTTDILARFGGEEFSVVLNNTDVAGASLLAERICQAARAARCWVDAAAVPFTISVGVATLAPGDDERTLFTRADRALYEAKRNGRDQVCVAPSAPEQV